MQWKLKVRNPSPAGESQTDAAVIHAESLSQAIRSAAPLIKPGFHGFSLVRVG